MATDNQTAGPLGPGDDDPRSPAATMASTAAGPLGPGDDDPRSPAIATALPATPPLGPGGSLEPADDRIMLAPSPAGPGGVDSGPRHVTHIAAPVPVVIAAPARVTPPAAAAPLPVDD